MGGNALKNCETRRLQKAEYLVLVERVINDLKNELSEPNWDRRVKNIPYYTSKEDFGDADILIDSCMLPADWVDRMVKKWDSKETYSNGDCVSFEVDGFQVDVIKSPSQEYEFAYNYFSYNDLGNLIGRMAKKLGLKYGHDGLWYVFRDGDQVVENILISYDPKRVYEILGLEYRKDFDTLEDIFEFVSSSWYFNPDIYLFENLNHISRIRDRKRKTYNAFLQWCEQNKSQFDTTFKFNEDKNAYLPYLFEFFKQEGFRDKWMAAKCKMLLQRDNRDKYSGEDVIKITGLTGKELGAFMTLLRTLWHKDFVTVNSKEAIMMKVAKQYEMWKDVRK